MQMIFLKKKKQRKGIIKVTSKFQSIVQKDSRHIVQKMKKKVVTIKTDFYDLNYRTCLNEDTINSVSEGKYTL